MIDNYLKGTMKKKPFEKEVVQILRRIVGQKEG